MVRLETVGETRVERLLWATLLGDLVSLEMVRLREVDPESIVVITGPQGERGPSAAFSFASALDRRNVGPELTELGHLDLPAGNYVLAAKVHTDNESSTTPMDAPLFPNTRAASC